MSDDNQELTSIPKCLHPLWRKASNKDHDAAYMLGCALDRGCYHQKIERNKDLAEKYLKAAADGTQNSNYLNSMGVYYELSRHNAKEALIWYERSKKAAEIDQYTKLGTKNYNRLHWEMNNPEKDYPFDDDTCKDL